VIWRSTFFGGNNPGLDEDDRDALTEEEQVAAFDEACAELAYDEVCAEWYSRLPAVLAEYYGRHLRAKYTLRIVNEKEGTEK